MAIVRSRKFLDDDGTISSKLLFSCIKEHRIEVESRLDKLNEYYDGNQLLQITVEILVYHIRQVSLVGVSQNAEVFQRKLRIQKNLLYFKVIQYTFI